MQRTEKGTHKKGGEKKVKEKIEGFWAPNNEKCRFVAAVLEADKGETTKTSSVQSFT